MSIQESETPTTVVDEFGSRTVALLDKAADMAKDECTGQWISRIS